MLLHFKDDVTTAREGEILAEFRGLRTRIPGIVSIEDGRDISTEGLSRGFQRAVVVTFRDRAARDVYLTHPEHVAFKTRNIGSVADILVVDYVVPPEERGTGPERG